QAWDEAGLRASLLTPFNCQPDAAAFILNASLIRANARTIISSSARPAMSTAVNFDTLEYVLDGLMRRYRERVPDVGRVIDAMIADGLISSADDIENDHIAFRTMGVPQLGIASLERIFLHLGYDRRDRYEFPEKKL